MARIIISFLYAYLIISMAGLPNLAQAAVSCSDVVDQTSGTTYTAALGQFLYFNGKTYAVSRSAVTGNTSLPDGFFAFDPTISREYLFDGIDISSLKKMLEAGKYGGAKPLSIKDTDTQAFILKYYAKYLQGASSSSATLLNVWKEFNAPDFTSIDGSALPYTNWDVQPTILAQPSAVAMGSDGKWSPVVSGQKLSQIVEFDGKLDCAIDMTPTLPTDPPASDPDDPVPGETPNSNDPSAIKDVLCSQDLNLNDYVGEPGEIMSCLTAPQGQLCPVGALDCNTDYQPPVCPSGSALNTFRDMCQKDPDQVNCAPGYSWDQTIDKCVMYPPCNDGGTYNSITDRCEKLVQNDCPANYIFDSTLQVCQKPVVCPGGGTFSAARDRCETPVVWDCPVGFSYNSSIQKCEAAPYCPSGWVYSTTTDRCQVAPNNCPAGYLYSSALDRCVVSATCPGGGVLNGSSDKCEVTAAITCNTATGWVYNSGSGKCEQAPTCAAPGSYSATYDVCMTASTGTSCPGGYYYSAAQGACVAAPACNSGSYNAGNDRCEASPSYSCPDPSYSYVAGRGRCEKAPVCPSGMSYNGTYNVCTQAITPTCGSGYTYNASRGRCEFQPPSCVSGTIYNTSTNRCESLPSCATGTYSADTNNCISSGTYAATVSNPVYANTPLNYMNVWNYGSTYYWPNFIVGTCTSKPMVADGCPGQTQIPMGNVLAYVTSRVGFNTVYINMSSVVGSNVYSSYSINPLYRICGGVGGYTPPCSSAAFVLRPSPAFDATTPVYSNGNSGVLLGYSSAVAGGVLDATYSCPAGGNLSGTSCITGGSYAATVANTCTKQVISGTYPSTTVAGYACANAITGGIKIPSYTNFVDALASSCATAPNYIYGWATTASTEVLTQPVSYSLKLASQATCFSGTIYLSPTPVNIYTCPSGSTLNGSTCYTDGTPATCPAGTSLDTVADRCVVNPTCAGGTFDSTNDVCYVSYTPSCTQGTYDGASGLCVTPPACSNGLLDGGNDTCYQASSGGCPGGYSLSGSVCIATPSCTVPGAFSGGAVDLCTTPATFICPSGYSYSAGTGQCYQTANCNGGGLNVTSEKCEMAFAYSCPATYSVTGALCQASPGCAVGGTYSTSLDLCSSSTGVCSTGLLDAGLDVCYQSAGCTGGVLNSGSDKCEATATPNCGTVSYDSSNTVCYSPPVCDSGAYQVPRDRCEATVTRNCGSYTWSDPDSKCLQPVTCPTDAGFSLNSSVQFSADLDRCLSDSEHICGSALSWNSQPVMKCEAVPICTGAIYYDPTSDSCLMNAGCPYGAQYACMQNPNLLNANGQGGWQCSPNACVNTGPGGAADIGDKMDESYFQDDGEKDADGNCLGTVYIFGGKPSRCRPPGLVVGTINDCCEPGDKIIDEDTGGNIQTAMSAISTLYDMAQVAYYSYGVATGAYTTAVGASGAVVLTSTTTAAATTLTGAVGAGVAGSAGAAGAGGAVASGLSSYAAALFNPATIAIAIVIFVVMKILMGSGCDQTDLQTTMARDSGMCHFVADYCFRKWAMVGCVQKAKGYCCFNSRLARIIHEQGRPQLTAFGADGGWGSLGSDPECRGFTPEEFQSIDFNLIDLSEYYDVVQKDMGDKLNNAQQNVLTTIQNKVNNINQ